MPQVKPEVEAFARIKVLGVGGSGRHAVDHMINSKVKGVEFVAINTDSQDLHHSLAKKKIHIGKNITRGLGAGMNPEMGRKAAEETTEEIQESIKGSDMVFVAGGVGGGTYSGAAPIVARAAKEQGALTVGVVTKPFFFEGQRRREIADNALTELRKNVDAIIIIPNDQLLAAIDKETRATDAFAMCDEVLRQAVEGISDLITTPGEVANIDFADIRSIMENAGHALMGVGTASGENRAVEAAKSAINSPLLELSIDGAQGVLFSIAGGADVTMFEIQEAAKTITESVDQNAKIIFGTVASDKLRKDEIKITVIASGFPERSVQSGGGAPLGSGIPESVAAQQPSQPAEPATQESAEPSSGGRIFNSFGGGNKQQTEAASQSTEDEKKKVEIEEDDDDDDWGAVPAFLRRSKLK
ncbi:MAG: cell division protein FtsZ [Candidatus Paceibacterota bacterium]